jgi:cysteine rich repeat protein
LNKRGLIATLRVAFLASLPLTAAAQDFLPGERARAVRMACATDFQRFCRDVPPGGGRILRCLSRHADLVSQPCFQALTVWGLTAANAYRMCLPDVERLCATLPPRSTQALSCLADNADKLSKACHDSLSDLELLNGRTGPQKGQ